APSPAQKNQLKLWSAVFAQLDAHNSDCYATGFIEYSDNSKGEWTISSGGTGGITWSRGDYVHLFYKYNKWYDPFACSYGLGDKGKC
ncbi:hypothetical protein, partial [Trinickia mobilis]|uniref:hypothetical protein n=1 Tax=Trinickia mobilis TaxID=2816356 RepID=UPI001A90C16B